MSLLYTCTAVEIADGSEKILCKIEKIKPEIGWIRHVTVPSGSPTDREQQGYDLFGIFRGFLKQTFGISIFPDNQFQFNKVFIEQ